MRKLIFVASLAAAALATPAMAQEHGPFTGVRVEGIVGWDRLHRSRIARRGAAISIREVIGCRAASSCQA